MKKIPTLFKRIFENGRVVGITDEVTEGMEWVLEGKGDATIKYDGACCAIIDGVFYKRYDAKNSKTPPEGAIPCCDPDPITGHWPHWVKVDFDNPADKWFKAAYELVFRSLKPIPASLGYLYDGTYEAVGAHFNGNPYGCIGDGLLRHGVERIEVVRTFDGIKQYLADHPIEGIVFWLNDEPMCKIKRSDFGFLWPIKKGEQINDE